MSASQEKSERIPPEDLERFRDAEWALHDPEVQQMYEGQWVVAYERKIIAHGPDATAVAEQASRVVKDQAHRLVFCGVEDPDNWLRHEADSSFDFDHA